MNCCASADGKGDAVLEVIETGRQVSGKEIRVQIQVPRPGDPSHLLANAEKAGRLLSWQPCYAEQARIIDTDWQWRQNHLGELCALGELGEKSSLKV